MSAVETEQVLVVPAELLRTLGYFEGFLAEDIERYRAELLSPEHTRFLPRGEMETDPRYKQLIPYVILRHRDAERGVRIFHYTRGSGQGEQRLHRKRSIGIGGHISAIDQEAASDLDLYQEGMRRELEEEVRIDSAYRERCVGLINDDATDVGRVHLGVVHVFDLETPQVAAREVDIADAGFERLDTLLAEIEQFESWSQIGLRALQTL